MTVLVIEGAGPGITERCRPPEQRCPKALDPSGVSWIDGCWCYRNRGSLVDYLREKIDAVDARCSCPTSELLATVPAPGFLLTHCVVHGEVRTRVEAR